MAEAKKLNELQRVQAKAVYNFKKRLREQEEEEAFKRSLEEGNPFAPEVPALVAKKEGKK